MFPEGVAYHSRTGNFFEGGTTDGTVFQGNVANEGEEAEVFLEPESDGRDTAVGVVDEGGCSSPGEIRAGSYKWAGGRGLLCSVPPLPDDHRRYDDRLLVVNSQFDRRQSSQEPELPFTVSSIQIPQK